MTADTAQLTTTDSPISLQRIPVSLDPFGGAALTLGPAGTQQLTNFQLAVA